MSASLLTGILATLAANGGGQSSSVQTEDLAITVDPPQPMAGETVNVTIAFADGRPINSALMRQTWVQTVMDTGTDPFVNNPAENRNLMPGWHGAHVYTSSGQRTCTVQKVTTGSAIETQTFDIDVIDPDTHAWTVTYWIDLNGDTTGMPAENAQNVHILSFDAFRQIGSSGSSASVRHRWRAGVMHTLTPTSINDRPGVNNGILRVDTFGGAGKAILDITTPTSFFDYNVYDLREDDMRAMFVDLEWRASYDPVTGEFNGPAVNCVNAIRNACRISIYGCSASGHHRMLSVTGYRVRGGIIDCFAENGQDYTLVSMASDLGFGIRGCHVTMPLNTSRGDGKPQASADFADHACARNNIPFHFSMSQNRGVQRGGWSNYGLDRAIQPFMRAHTEDSRVGTLTLCLWNRVQARILLHTGHHSAGSTQQNPVNALVVGNSIDHPGHGTEMVESNSAGGVTMYGNASYVANVDFAQASGTYQLLRQSLSGTASLGVGVWEEPSYCGYNTALSDRSSTGFNKAGDMVQASNVATITVENNILSGDQHTGAGLTPSAQLSRGDDFRVITGGSLDAPVAGGPPISFDRVLNTGGAAMAGAHKTAGADVAVSQPVITGATIERLGAYSALTGGNQYAVTGVQGVVENGNATMGWNWRLNGVDFDKTTGGDMDRDFLLPVIDLENQTGTLTCVVTLANRSGVNATVESAPLEVV